MAANMLLVTLLPTLVTFLVTSGVWVAVSNLWSLIFSRWHFLRWLNRRRVGVICSCGHLSHSLTKYHRLAFWALAVFYSLKDSKLIAANNSLHIPSSSTQMCDAFFPLVLIAVIIIVLIRAAKTWLRLFILHELSASQVGDSNIQISRDANSWSWTRRLLFNCLYLTTCPALNSYTLARNVLRNAAARSWEMKRVLVAYEPNGPFH